MTESRSSNYKWWLVFMLWFVCFFNYADRQAIYSVFDSLKVEFGFNKEQLGLIGSAFMVVYAGASPLAGMIGDRFPRKGLILGGLFFWSFITVTTAWATQFWHFWWIRALEGFGEAFYFPASMALISAYHGAHTRSKAMSFHQSSVYVGTIGGGYLGGLFAETLGWRYGFYFFGMAGILLSAILVFSIKEPPRNPPAPVSPDSPRRSTMERNLIDILSQPRVWILMLAFILANSVAGSFLVWAPNFLRDKFQFSLSISGLTGTLFIHGASMLSVPLGGWMADRFRIKDPGGRMLVQCIGLAGGAAFVYLTARTTRMDVLITSMILFGLFKGLYDSNIFAALYDVVPAHAQSTAAGLMNAVGWVGGALAPIIIGVLAHRSGSENEIESMSYSLAFGGIIYLLGAGLLAIGIWMARRSEREKLVSV